MTTTITTSESPTLTKKPSMADIKSSAALTQTTFGCPHIKMLLTQARQQATDQYTRLIQSIQKEGNFSDKTLKSDDRATSTSRVTYLCLQCPNVSKSKERHKEGHAFAVESEHGFVLCHDCKDFVYDPTFEEVRAANKKKRKHSALLPADDKKLVNTNSGTTPCAATGLRGLYNMGQTCFMSVILQSLIHNPLIRSYYLSEGHRSADCERDACTSCALDDIFTDFFGQEKHEGYGAVHMLQGCWKGGGGLAGYSQQDAHEYLGFILNNLHTANLSDDEDDDEDEEHDKKKKKKNPHDHDCDCVIHSTFGGMLKSTVTCTKCHTTSTASDPFMDLSLDIRSNPSQSSAAKKKKLGLTNGAAATAKEHLPMDLSECLDRFTAPETLSADSYTCRKCSAGHEAKKQLTLSRLPPVIPIHLKRFSHSKTLATSSKVDTRIRFPFTLNLSPYLHNPSKRKDASKASEKEKDANSKSSPVKPAKNGTEDNAEGEDGLKNDPVYDLSSVIVHKGKIDNGHYISYSKQGEEWFRFDDSMVAQVGAREVLGAEAYMLFYVVRDV